MGGAGSLGVTSLWSLSEEELLLLLLLLLPSTGLGVKLLGVGILHDFFGITPETDELLTFMPLGADGCSWPQETSGGTGGQTPRKLSTNKCTPRTLKCLSGVFVCF